MWRGRWLLLRATSASCRRLRRSGPDYVRTYVAYLLVPTYVRRKQRSSSSSAAAAAAAAQQQQQQRSAQTSKGDPVAKVGEFMFPELQKVTLYSPKVMSRVESSQSTVPFSSSFAALRRQSHQYRTDCTNWKIEKIEKQRLNNKPGDIPQVTPSSATLRHLHQP